jgi:hypothetical protein
MSQGLSSHGTLIARGTGGSFTTIGELGGDIIPPALQRPITEITPHNDDIDSYVVGVLRRGEVTFTINFLPSDATHNETAGLIKSMLDKTYDGFRVTFPDTTEWIFSGFVSNFAPSATVREGALTADVSIRPSGPQKIADTEVS